MSKEYTPTTDNVKAAYRGFVRNAFVTSNGQLDEEFDRWLKLVEQKSYEEGYLQGFKNGQDISE